MRSCVLLAQLAIMIVVPMPAHAQDGTSLIVSPEGPYTTIDAALGDAHDGDVIKVHGGTYEAPLVVDKSVSILGIDNPIIDGRGQGTLVIIDAPGTIFQGFWLRNSGDNLHHEDSGIVVQAANVTVADNVLDDVLFGIYMANAPHGTVRNNVVRGKDLDPARRGDGIRVWFSNDVTLLGNEVTSMRDTLIWYAEGITINDNHFHGNRYGIHFMYSSGAEVHNNTIEANSVGAYLMYSGGLSLSENTFRDNRGPSGYGLALRDMDEVEVGENLFAGNRVGLYIDNSPSAYEGYNTFDGNLFAYNDTGITTLPAVERNIFQSNGFLENAQQVSTRGRGVMTGNLWSQDGAGNYWSDYTGYDEDGDGIGDMPYRAEKLFESLADEYPALLLFAYSPASQAIDFAAASFPTLRTEPKLVDNAPLVRYVPPEHFAADKTPIVSPLLGVSLLMVGLVGGLGAVTYGHTNAPITGRSEHAEGQTAVTTHSVVSIADNMIIAENLTKTFGQFAALDRVSFSIQPGESVALWGANGAGKTTALRCLLGLTSYSGKVTVNGIDVAQNGKAARATIGYVPQGVAFHDLTVRDTLTFYANLQKVPLTRLSEVLAHVRLEEQVKKPVNALSGGMRQRLALAVALLSEPPVLVLDEPTANLDAQARSEFLQLVRTLNQAGKTIVFATHRLDEVEALAGRVFVLEDGKFALECQPDQLAEKLGLQRWLRIWVASDQLDEAIHLLRHGAHKPVLNGRAIYVRVGQESKMIPLRMLEATDISVEDFDLVEDSSLPVQDGTA